MKILPLLSLGLGLSLFATPMPSYKTSLGLEVGSSSTVLSIDSGYEEKYNDIMYGLSFKMEDRINETNFYYGIGVDYSKFTLKAQNQSLDIETYNLYPVLSYNFTRNFSINTFAGLSYQDFSAKQDDVEKSENELTFLYGVGIDYAISKNITNGIVLRKYQPYDFKDSGINVDTTTLSYRIGLSF
jgi:opacity protein-like surface antigen